MNKNTVQSTFTRRAYHAVTPLIVYLAATYTAATAVAQPVTFAFAGQLSDPPSPALPLPPGQRITGTYTFDLSTPPGIFPNTAIYDSALTDFRATLDGIGIGSCSTGGITLSNPGQTIGSSNFLSDKYKVYGYMTGITVPTPAGDVHLYSASILLQDLDQTGLDSVQLSATPPNLAPFLDHSGPNYDSDKAQITLDFLTRFGTVYGADFQLTSLVAVPEPSTIWLALAGMATVFIRCRRPTSHSRV